MKSYYN